LSKEGSFQDKISERYSQLSGTLQVAADFIIANPLDVASRSLRSIAMNAGVSPASFSRLAKALGYDSYEELREESRRAVSDKFEPISDRAKRLRAAHENPTYDIVREQGAIIRANIDAIFSDIDGDRLESASKAMLSARKVHLIGSLGSAGLLDQFSYMAGWFLQDWHVTGRNGITLASTLANLSEDDVVLVLSMAPFAKRSILATKLAAEKKAKVIVITDSHKFPGLAHATEHFIVRSESSNFFSSYSAAMALFETMISMMVSLSGKKADIAISKMEEANKRLEEF
jgi:DNA-binding MurR/RpiR family transcriptional regulator